LSAVNKLRFTWPTVLSIKEQVFSSLEEFSRGMMVMYGSIYTVTFLILGALLPVPTLGAKQESPPDPCLSIAKEPLENSALEPCVGPSCLRWCDGNCKSRCGPNETVGLGYCGRGCKCCQTKFPSCQKSCGSGGNCRNAAISKPSCPPGEKVISGNCGSTISCVCCGRDQPTGCLGRCATSRGSGTCRRTCGFGEVRLGRCPGGKCSCCRPRIPSVCSGICKTGNQW
ncbi:unnamed protein product, partial [Meganyctiphanes norvegica]